MSTNTRLFFERFGGTVHTPLHFSFAQSHSFKLYIFGSRTNHLYLIVDTSYITFNIINDDSSLSAASPPNLPISSLAASCCYLLASVKAYVGAVCSKTIVRSPFVFKRENSCCRLQMKQQCTDCRGSKNHWNGRTGASLMDLHTSTPIFAENFV